MMPLCCEPTSNFINISKPSLGFCKRSMVVVLFQPQWPKSHSALKLYLCTQRCCPVQMQVVERRPLGSLFVSLYLLGWGQQQWVIQLKRNEHFRLQFFLSGSLTILQLRSPFCFSIICFW